MTDGSMARDDRGLEAALRALADEIDWPTPAPMAAGATSGPDIAARVRARLVAGERRHAPRRWWTFGGRPIRRSLVLAIAALLALAIVAGAVGLGLPGLRITFGEPPVSPQASPSASSTGNGSPTPSPTLPPIAGMRLSLGRQVTLDEVEPMTGVPVRLPTDERLGPPDSVWVDPETDPLSQLAQLLDLSLAEVPNYLLAMRLADEIAGATSTPGTHAPAFREGEAVFARLVAASAPAVSRDTATRIARDALAAMVGSAVLGLDHEHDPEVRERVVAVLRAALVPGHVEASRFEAAMQQPEQKA